MQVRMGWEWGGVCVLNLGGGLGKRIVYPILEAEVVYAGEDGVGMGWYMRFEFGGWAALTHR